MKQSTHGRFGNSPGWCWSPPAIAQSASDSPVGHGARWGCRSDHSPDWALMGDLTPEVGQLGTRTGSNRHPSVQHSARLDPCLPLLDPCLPARRQGVFCETVALTIPLIGGSWTTQPLKSDHVSKTHRWRFPSVQQSACSCTHPHHTLGPEQLVHDAVLVIIPDPPLTHPASCVPVAGRRGHGVVGVVAAGSSLVPTSPPKSLLLHTSCCH